MTWSKVQSNSNFKDGSSASTLAIVLPSTVGAASIIYGFAWVGGAKTLTSVTDDKGNTYTILDVINSSGRMYSFYCLNVTNGPQTITLHISGASTFWGAIVGELAGGDASSTLTGHIINNQSSAGTGTDAVTTGTSIGNSGDILVGGTAQIIGNGDTVDAGTGFTLDISGDNVDGVLWSEYKILSAASLATFTTHTADHFITAAMSFSPAASGGTDTTLIPGAGSIIITGQAPVVNITGVYIASVATGHSTNSNTSVNKPIGKWLQGNMLVAIHGSDAFNSTAPSGNSAFTSIDVDSLDSLSRLSYHICGASEPSNYVFFGNGTTPDSGSVTILEISGQDSTNPINAHIVANNNNKSVSWSSVTTTVDKCLILLLMALDITNSPPSFSLPFGYNFVGGENDGGSSGTFSEYTNVWAAPKTTAGATGTNSSTITSAASAANSFWGAYTLAISPPVTTETPSPGQIIFTGKTPSVLIGNTLIPSKGQIIFTGKTPKVLVGNNIIPGKGQIIFTGKTPVLNEIFIPNKDSVVFTGKIPAVNKAFIPGKGQIIFTGKAPVLFDEIFTPGSGSIIFTGKIPSLNKAFIPGKGQIIFTGKAPLVDETLIPSKGQIVFTGKAPLTNSIFPVIESPGSGSISFNGKTPKLNEIFIPGNNSISFNGKTPKLLETFVPSKGQIVFTGKAPVLFDEIFTPESGSIIFTGKSPEINEILFPANGQIIFTGKTPKLLETFVPSKGNIEFSGKIPIFEQKIIPGKGQIIFTGKAPDITRILFPDAGNIIFTGKIPKIYQNMFPGKGNISFSGKTPKLLQTFIPGNNSITFTGKKPIVINNSQIVIGANSQIIFTGFVPSLTIITTNIIPSSGQIIFSGKAPILNNIIPKKPHGLFSKTFTFDIIRKYIVVFGYMFSDLFITRQDSNNETIDTIAVPIEYSEKDKMLSRLKINPDEKRSISVDLPRMGYQLSNVVYDSNRKLNTLNKKYVQANNHVINYQYSPVPYNFEFDLYIISKNLTDGYRILEQILPFFTPDYQFKMNLIPEMDQEFNTPFILKGINFEDSYTGEIESDRRIIWTLKFVVKGYLFNRIKKTGLIKNITINFRIPTTNTAAEGVGITPVSEYITIEPGLLANGSPTSNSSLSIPLSEINANSNYGFIVDIL